jgi:AcrR family transcriptional regulator
MAEPAQHEDLRPREMQRPGGRTEAIRKRVIAATTGILADEGVTGVTVEAVASRSKVARTTIYRRWRSPAGLMLEALREELGPRASRILDTGSLRGDLKALIDDVTAFLGTETGRGIMKVAFIGHESPYATQAIQSYWTARFEAAGKIIERAVARGELASKARGRELLELLAAPIYFRVFMTREEIGETYLNRLVEYVLIASGARDIGGRKRRRTPKITSSGSATAHLA